MIVCKGEGCDKKTKCEYFENWFNPKDDCDDRFIGVIDEDQCRNGNTVLVVNSTENGDEKSAE